MPHAVVADRAFELVDELRALGPRADEAHLAAQHVEELRQLVQPRLADERADAGHAVVVGGRPARHAIALGIGAHATKLDQAETLPALADAHLPVQRSEEHTSELQSLMRTSYAVFCLQKKKTLTNRGNN